MEDGKFLYPSTNGIKDNFKPGMSWGFIHPDYAHNALGYEGKGIKEYRNILHLINEPFNGKVMHQGIEYHPKVISGCIHSKVLYKYGEFEIDCKIPRNGKTWPAFWLYGTTWPPEIDVFEYMPDSDTRGKKKLGAGIYYGDPRKEGGFRIRVGKPGDRVKVALDWTPNYLRWYYNGVLFKEVTNPKIMKYFQQEMYLVVGTGVSKDFDRYVFNQPLTVNHIIYKSLN